jgi:hypothetical protein
MAHQPNKRRTLRARAIASPADHYFPVGQLAA